MLLRRQSPLLFILFVAVGVISLSREGIGQSWFQSHQRNNNVDKVSAERCFCELKGQIDDCSCSVEALDSLNNLKVYPRLNSLLQKDYFRYWKVNLNKGCPFWADDGRCAVRYCSVQPCVEVPEGLARNALNDDPRDVNSLEESALHKEDCDTENNLGYLNTTLSDESKAEFERWAAHDSAQDDSFCYLDDEHAQESHYVDLLLNPERYTGYAGLSAHRVWRSIYQENCFKPQRSYGPYSDFKNVGAQEYLKGMCLEKRTFYRAISGLHSSINIHLSARYLLADKDGFQESPDGVWGPNVEEFQVRFDPQLTNGEGPQRLKNLYFLYLLELRAFAKAASYLEALEFYTGNKDEDADVQAAVKDLVNVVRSFTEHFDERTLFTGGKQAQKLKEEFRLHFRNISRIMDCVGCEKCRLWGKLQVTGLGTALKILFSSNLNSTQSDQSGLKVKTSFKLTRNEIVALFNAFGRLSNSIFELENFQRLIDKQADTW